jgi:hypothetical protein
MNDEENQDFTRKVPEDWQPRQTPVVAMKDEFFIIGPAKLTLAICEPEEP